MKSLHRILVSFGIVACLAGVYFVMQKHVPPAKKQEEVTRKKRYSGADKQMSYLFQTKAYPDPTYLNDKWMAAWEHAQAMKRPKAYNPAARTPGGNWSQVSGLNVGRVLTVAIDPNNSNKIFAGSASGGIWKSENAGGNWSYVNVGLPVLGVPAIAFHPTNSNIIIAGTGEVYRSDTSNIGFNVWKARGSYGIGIIRSTDGGNTWTQVLYKSYSNLFGVQRLVFDPNNSNTVYACTTHGLFKSTDAGATWSTTPMLDGKYVSDVLIRRGSSNTIVAAVGNLTNTGKGIYKTTNGGSSWTHVTGTGFPSVFHGFVRLAAHPTDADVIFASVGMGVTTTNNHRSYTDNELYKSSDFGSNWTVKNNSLHANFQHWFAHAIAVNPGNGNKIILGGVKLYRYTDGTGSSGSVENIHGSLHDDIHDVVFDPNNSNILYVACDGGVYRTTNINGANAGNVVFQTRNSGLEIAQFYASLGVSKLTANRFIGGLQDNGVWAYNNGSWSKRLGGDGGPSAIAPNSDNTVLASNDALTVNRSTGGVTGTFKTHLGSWAFVADDRTAFMAPIAFAPSDPSIAYAASDNLHRSTSGGDKWTNGTYSSANRYIEAQYKTAVTLAVSPTNPNKVYVSLSPFSQRVDNKLNVTGGPTLRKTTNADAATPTWTTVSGGLPNHFIMDIAIKPNNDDSIMVALGGYGDSHIWLSGDGGATWVNRGIGLPDVPFNAIVFDPVHPTVVYAGSDLGIYVSPDLGLHWFDFNDGFSDATMVFDLQITADNRIVAATHGKGLMIGDLADISSLPVNIISFTGARKNSYNELRWKVTDEHNVARYEIERRVDNGTFVKVGQVTALNNTGIHTYTFDDNIANVAGTNFYYRLKIVDIDNSYEYSSVVLLKVHRPGKFEILGNPITAGSSMRLTLPAPQTVTFRLFDMKGRLIKVNKVSASAGANTYSFNMFGMLATGQYVVEAITPDERFTKRIVKH